MEKIQLCVRHCAGYLSGRVDGGFQLCDLKNLRFLLVKKQLNDAHTLLFQLYFVSFLTLCYMWSLYFLWKCAYLWKRCHLRQESHYDQVYEYFLWDRKVCVCREGEVCQEIRQMRRKPTRYKLDFPDFTKLPRSQLERSPALNYYTLVKSGKVAEFLFVLVPK